MTDFSIIEDNDYYIISGNHFKYKLVIIKDLNYFYSVYNSFIYNNVYNKIIYNRFGEFITYINGNYYVLIEEKLHLDKILPFIPIKLDYYYSICWLDTWKERYFYYERYRNDIEGIDEIIYESFDYYLGLLFLSIIYLIDCSNLFTEKACLCHKMFSSENYFDFFSLKVDIEEREFSEYIKYLFFECNNSFLDIKKILNERIRYYNASIVYSRLLYPNYYFNNIDKAIIEKTDLNSIKRIIDLHVEYEKILEYYYQTYLVV